MTRIAPSAFALIFVSLACLTPLQVAGLIMVGRGNQPVPDAGWPAGALAMANFESRIGWWEGQPFGGGESHFLFCGNTEGFKDALAQYDGHAILVEVEPKGGSKVGSWGGSAKVKDDGTFEFNNVPPGEYRITSRPNPANSNRQYASEQVVTVAPGERTNVKVIYE
jgi:hypothetical protein